MDQIKKRAVLYLRVSTQEQATEGYSLAAQEQNGREQAARMGYEIVQVYADEGKSGKSTKHRFAYQQMMEDAKDGKFELLIIWKLTRLSRNMMDTLQTVEELLKHNIELYSISERFDITTAMGKMMLQMLGTFAEFERNQISENVQMTMKSLVRDQERYAGGRRLGYVSGLDVDGNKQLIIEEEEAKIVRLIYSKYLEGMGYRHIANHLNRQGYRTVKSNEFSSVAVRDILKNKIYGGYIEYARYEDWDTKRRRGKNDNPIIVKGHHEPIIDEEMYQKVQDNLKQRSVNPQWNQTGQNVLTGLLKCPKCGSAMAASNVTNTLKGGVKKRIRYYSCSEFRNKGASVCSANSIRADFAEKFVAERFKELIQLPEVIEQLVYDMNHELEEQTKPLEQELAVLLSEKERVSEKLLKWQESIMKDPELVEMLKEHILELQQQIQLFTNRENEILGLLRYQEDEIRVKDVRLLFNNLDVLLDEKNKKEVKELYRIFIEKITFDLGTRDNIQITVKFDQSTVDQLNEAYRKAESSYEDSAFFVLRTPFQLSV